MNNLEDAGPKDPALHEGLSPRLVGRLSLYRRLLTDLKDQGTASIYSHTLAATIGGSAAQVRRDLMTIGFSGSPVRGYDIVQLIGRISAVLDAPGGQRAALVGVGNLGRAILSYFAGRRPALSIAAAFDQNPEKTGRVLHGCRCHAIDQLAAVVSQEDISIGIITVPAGQAQLVADRMIAAGLTSIVNFAPVRLHVPARVYLEEIDITTSLEKAAFFGRAGGTATAARRRG